LAEDGLAASTALGRGSFRLEAALEVRPGETLALVGPNGAGKSTFLAIVAGLERPDRGRIVCDGEVWCDTERGLHLPPERRHVGLLFQDYALFPHLSVGENVAYGPRARGRSRAEAEAAAAHWIERLALRAQAARRADLISGGERQRAALARALATAPRVLLLDEPFAALDVTTRGAVRAELRTFLSSCGLPTVLVTHDPVDALALGDRLAVLEEGRMSQVGTREELLARPRTAFVAELVGLNLYRADVAAGPGLKEARVGTVVFHVLADERHGPSFLAFAPSEVALSAERLSGSAQNSFPGAVTEVLPLPDRLRVVLDVGLPLAAEVTREAAASLALAPGRRLWATVKATAIRVYG
jgi:molybdate transport system ATP-binding protein